MEGEGDPVREVGAGHLGEGAPVQEEEVGEADSAVIDDGHHQAVVLGAALGVRNEEGLPGIVAVQGPRHVLQGVHQVLLDEALAPVVYRHPTVGKPGHEHIEE